MYLFSMSKPIQEYLPKRSHMEKTMIQGRVDTPLVKEVRKILEKENLTWSDVLTACLKSFVDSNGKDEVK